MRPLEAKIMSTLSSSVRTKHTIGIENAERIDRWLRERGGIAIWQSINLSNPGASWTTPALTEDGKPYPKPTRQAANEPTIITDPADILVAKDVEVKRFHIAVRLGGNGLQYKVSDGGTRRIRKAVVNAGEGAYYVFDYAAQEAFIMKPESTVSLGEWRTTHDAAVLR
jgi:hypothetical protein